MPNKKINNKSKSKKNINTNTNKNKIHIFIDNSKKSVKRQPKNNAVPKQAPSFNIINQVPQLARGNDDDLHYFAKHYINQQPAPKTAATAPLIAPIDIVPPPIDIIPPPTSAAPASTSTRGRPKGSLNKPKIFAEAIPPFVGTSMGKTPSKFESQENFSNAFAAGGGGSAKSLFDDEDLHPNITVRAKKPANVSIAENKKVRIINKTRDTIVPQYPFSPPLNPHPNFSTPKTAPYKGKPAFTDTKLPSYGISTSQSKKSGQTPSTPFGLNV